MNRLLKRLSIRECILIAVAALMVATFAANAGSWLSGDAPTYLEQSAPPAQQELVPAAQLRASDVYPTDFVEQASAACSSATADRCRDTATCIQSSVAYEDFVAVETSMRDRTAPPLATLNAMDSCGDKAQSIHDNH